MLGKCLVVQCFQYQQYLQTLTQLRTFFTWFVKNLKVMHCKMKLQERVINEFCKRVAKTLKEFPVSIINKTIDSMERRLKMVIKLKQSGERTRY